MFNSVYIRPKGDFFKRKEKKWGVKRPKQPFSPILSQPISAGVIYQISTSFQGRSL